MNAKRLLSAIALPAVLFVVVADSMTADDSRTLTGRYFSGEDSGKLTAVFAPTGTGIWNVVFHFAFQGQPHTYEGTAEGSLAEGRLEGTARNENGKRTFTFTGEWRKGSFRGTHFEIENGRMEQTGTLTLQE